jgi:hypothetical protein
VKTALIACLATAVLASGAAAETTADAAKKCPRGKARVTIAGKSSCVARAAVLPKRRTGDGLAPVLRQGLDPAWGETRDGPKTLTQLVGADRKSVADQAIARALTRLKSGGGGRYTAMVGKATAACKYTQVLPVTSESYSEDLGGGARLEAQMRTGPNGATMSLSVTVPTPSGRAVRITVDLGLCAGERLEVDSCPTAQGIVQGSDNNDGTIKVEQLEAGAVVESQVTKVNVVTKLRGQVETNAKLKFVEIERTETYDTSIDYGRWFGIGQRINVRRTATISMPSGQYLAGTGSLDVQQSFRGLLSFLVNESAAREAVIASARKASDESWSKFVDEAIKKYKEREAGWQKPVCAELAFSPRSNTLRVRLGQQGLFTGTVRAKRGGSAVGEWRITARRNLGLRAGSNSTAASITYRYRVDREGRVSATFRVPSRAGVAEGTWEQGGSEVPRQITGTFSGRSGGSVEISWSGTVTFVRNDSLSGVGRAWYEVEKVTYTSTYSVNEAGCRGQSTGSASLGRQGQRSFLLLDTRAVNRMHRYEVNAHFEGPPTATIVVTCLGGVSVSQPWPPSAILLTAPKTFVADSRTWRFSGTNSVGPFTSTWDLVGTR